MFDPKIVHVVGDRFAAFAEATGAWTVAEAIAALETGTVPDGRVILQPGQGVGRGDAERISAAVRRYRFDSIEVGPRPERPLPSCDDLLIENSKDILISGLRRDSDTEFSADLRLSADLALLTRDRDVMHVPGLLAIEACDHMFFAVAARYFGNLLPDRWLATIDRLETEFHNFLYPVPATLRLTLKSAEPGDRGDYRFVFTIVLEQAGRITSVHQLERRVIDRELIDAKERRHAVHALPVPNYSVR
ncbi:hypothetical protein LTV02_20185 [Nocardia yamanashiensis]|uniref:AfsA-related hotdog domain-containing protein n=1 Tax=Nocardia yamanashiensis TaxID=209247 RepID=UPI00082F30D7|nr:AfsA-related hotdog domain-containing protein [Nocardia yamanashiensis]UGT38481.1 hypothetical protein LTV02_20185 [Nocardia yamanashiensis]